MCWSISTIMVFWLVLYNAYFIEYFPFFFCQRCTYIMSLFLEVNEKRQIHCVARVKWTLRNIILFSTIFNIMLYSNAKWKADMTQPWTDINDLYPMLEDFLFCFRNLFKSYLELYIFIMLLLYRFSANVCISEIKYLWTLSLENNLQPVFRCNWHSRQ